MNELINVHENYQAYRHARTGDKTTIERRHKRIIIVLVRAGDQKAVLFTTKQVIKAMPDLSCHLHKTR